MRIEFDLPDEFRTDLEEREIRMAAAAKLYELGRLSSGAAAKLAGIPRVAFLSEVGSYGVSVFQVTPEELEAEISVAREQAARGRISGAME